MKYYIVSYKEGKFGSPTLVYHYNGFFDTVEAAQERLSDYYNKYPEATWAPNTRCKFFANGRVFAVASTYNINRTQ